MDPVTSTPIAIGVEFGCSSLSLASLMPINFGLNLSSICLFLKRLSALASDVMLLDVLSFSQSLAV